MLMLNFGCRPMNNYEAHKNKEMQLVLKLHNETNDLIEKLEKGGLYQTLKLFQQQLNVSVKYNRIKLGKLAECQKKKV